MEIPLIESVLLKDVRSTFGKGTGNTLDVLRDELPEIVGEAMAKAKLSLSTQWESTLKGNEPPKL